MIKKEAEIFGLLFLGDGTTISRCSLSNILVLGGNILAAVLEIVYCQGHFADRMKKIWYIHFLYIFGTYEGN